MIKHAHRFAVAALCLVSLSAYAYAQRDDSRFDFYARGPYREAVPRPQVVTRFDVGRFHTNYATMERWLDRVAQAAPDRVRVTDIGETNEHRMMHVVVVTAPENLRRLEEIKGNLRKLSDPRGLSADEAKRITDATPLAAWMAYTIHGNESASFEAMMQVVYQLAASDEPATLDVLKNTVVLVVTGENPDGHERFVTWYNGFATGDANPLAGEHREPWSVTGRFNHSASISTATTSSPRRSRTATSSARTSNGTRRSRSITTGSPHSSSSRPRRCPSTRPCRSSRPRAGSQSSAAPTPRSSISATGITTSATFTIFFTPATGTRGPR
ncbi:MAG: M14 family zinc carboxypeptidase [Pyrinomonadaceae bacterium]